MSNQLMKKKEFCWEDVLFHNNPEVRYAANIDLKLLCQSVTDPKDPRIRDLGHLFNKTVTDSAALVQDEALDALIAYLKAADAHVAGRYANEVCDAVMTIALTGGPKTQWKAQMVFMLWVELEAVEAFLDAMEKAVTSQVPSAVLLAIDFMILVVSEFGREIVPLNRIIKMLLDILDHQDQNVIASSKRLTCELCRWLGINAIKYILYDKMSDKMKGELNVELPTIKFALRAPHRLRYEPKVSGFLSLLIYGSYSGPSEESAAEETSRLQKMSLSDPKEQNKKVTNGEDGYYQFQNSIPPHWLDDKPPLQLLEVEWCTECGMLDDGNCRCKQMTAPYRAYMGVQPLPYSPFTPVASMPESEF